jgi:hypothetical protein
MPSLLQPPSRRPLVDSPYLDSEVARSRRQQEDGYGAVAAELVHEGLALGGRRAPLQAAVREPKRVHEAAQQIQTTGQHQEAQDAVEDANRSSSETGFALKVVSAGDWGSPAAAPRTRCSLFTRNAPYRESNCQVLFLGLEAGVVGQCDAYLIGVRRWPVIALLVPVPALLFFRCSSTKAHVRGRLELELHGLKFPSLRGEDLVQHVSTFRRRQAKGGEQPLELVVRRRSEAPFGFLDDPKVVGNPEGKKHQELSAGVPSSRKGQA